MTNYREILRLKSLGYTQRSIASGAKVSRNTVSEVLKKAEQLNITWPLEDDATNEMLDELFYGKRNSDPSPYAVIDFDYIHRELEHAVWRQIPPLGSNHESYDACHA